MIPRQRDFCIKAGYQPNFAGLSTRETATVAAYWTEELIRASEEYQFDVYRLAAKLIRRSAGPAVLDVGSGPPTKLRALLGTDLERVTLVDDASVRDLARSLMPRARFVAADLESIQVDLEERYDLVICSDVVEHLVNPDPCLQFVRNHLAPDGILLISTPERDVLRGRDCVISPDPNHVREWNRAEFRRYLESRDFRVLAQRLLPKKRYFTSKRWLGVALSSVGLPPRWYSCQLAVCRLGSRGAEGTLVPS